ncbi:hypothetical protein P278_31700 [Zhouia amylolytica AD3]|uniref:Uncharacterized protein n=1 Tax=Zhouia amylolytica AD3 TaxID=1286632 RepID=W2UI04_9FLAO|nr:hypothetical protein P278_31700 [Zhouia amylolytica AD3]
MGITLLFVRNYHAYVILLPFGILHGYLVYLRMENFLNTEIRLDLTWGDMIAIRFLATGCY